MCAPQLVAGLGSDLAVVPGERLMARLGKRRRRRWPRRARVVDLTHPLRPGFPVFPAFEPPHVAPATSIARDGFFANTLTLNEHTGTHVDAPAHFIAGAAGVDALDPAALLAPLVVVRIGERAARDPDSELDLADLRRWERRHGKIPRGAIVAMDSGWSARAGSREAFLGLGAGPTLHFPGAGAEAAAFLVSERAVAAVAVDTLSLDPGAASDPATHRVVLGSGRYGIECVAGLDRVPERGALAVVGALPTHGGSGAPARMLALL